MPCFRGEVVIQHMLTSQKTRKGWRDLACLDSGCEMHSTLAPEGAVYTVTRLESSSSRIC